MNIINGQIQAGVLYQVTGSDAQLHYNGLDLVSGDYFRGVLGVKTFNANMSAGISEITELRSDAVEWRMQQEAISTLISPAAPANTALVVQTTAMAVEFKDSPGYQQATSRFDAESLLLKGFAIEFDINPEIKQYQDSCISYGTNLAFTPHSLAAYCFQVTEIRL